MKYLKFLFLLTCLLFTGNRSFSSAKGQANYKTFIGEMNNKIGVVFSLKNTAGKISGYYFYDKIGVEIKLEGEEINGITILYELDDQQIKRARIKGRLSKYGFTGSWESLSSKKIFSLKLKATDNTVPPLPSNLTGTYTFSKETGCNLKIVILKDKGGYRYNFKSTTRSLQGKVTFIRSLQEKSVYINFHGIQWAENRGDISKEDPDDSPTETEYLPNILDGVLSDNEIIIQNYGNAMNYYTKLEECTDEKYIRLTKR